MPQAEDLDEFETALIARWRVIAPMMPPNGDLKRHLAERRSIAEVLENRRCVRDVSSTNLHRLSRAPAHRFADAKHSRDAA
jgi:hypothetical protein